jgi:predicted metal-dependent peptidase
MTEVDSVIAALGIPGASVTVLACDAAVSAVTRVRKATDATLVGGGGTDMRVGIAAATRQRPRPDLIVVLTDGYTPWPNTPPPGSAVIAAMLGRPDETLPNTPDWASRIECVLNG